MQHLSAISIPIFDRFTYGLLFLGWLVYVAIAPIYVFKSGLPQPADFIIVVTAGLTAVLFFLKQKIVFNRVFALLILIVMMFFSINVANFLYYRDVQFLYSSIYYVFNALVFSGTIILFKQDAWRAIDWGRYAIFVSILIEIFWIKVIGSNSEFRETGSFNNPNQLGYWSLLTTCYILMLNYGRRLKIIDVLVILACGYFITLALSRAVLLSYVLILIVFFTNNYLPFLMKVLVCLIITSYTLIQIAVFENISFLVDNFQFIENVVDRVETIQTEKGVIEERGYQRIWEYPMYLFYGAGEGAYYRFESYGGIRGLELHSGLGTLVFSYGIFGFALFSAFVLCVFRKAPMAFWIILTAIMAYGITHQHIRFTGFWLFLGIAYSMKNYVILPSQARASSHPPQ